MNKSILKTILLSLFSFSSLYSFGQCEAKLKDFYVAYMQNMEKNSEANVDLLKAHMSPELIEKIQGYTMQYDADAVIHSQDVCEYCIESLIIVPLGKDDGYLVKYKWSPESNYAFIPVRAVENDGKLTILDVFPVGTDSQGKSYIKRK